MNSKSPSFSTTTITELMIPSYANFSGKIHGGILLSLMDKVAFACGSKHSGEYCVTVSVEGVEFFQPVEVGELVSLTGSVIYVGKTSMIVGIHIESLKPKTGETKHTNSCYFTMVSVDEDGKTLPVPRLQLDSEAEEKLFQAGKMRCAMRKEIQERNLKLHVGID